MSVISKEQAVIRGLRSFRSGSWHSHGYLPHEDGENLTQFVTLRLFDSLPQEHITKLRDDLSRSPMTPDAASQSAAIKRKRIEELLDSGYGECFLRKKEIATLLERSLLYFHEIRYTLHAWVIMPNHIHLLLTMRKKFALSATIASYKSYTARNANCLLARSGQFWFPEYYDRYIRNAQHFENVVHYIHQNPVKAGLCVDPGNWLFSSIGARRSDASLK